MIRRILGWMFKWEQRIRKLPSAKDWARRNGFPEIGTRGKIPMAALRKYREHFGVVTPLWSRGKRRTTTVWLLRQRK